MFIGLVGAGFVGTALKEGMKHACDVLTYDKYKKELSNVSSILDLCKQTEIIFVCVPTPMRKSTGECDTSIVETVVKEISEGYATLFKPAHGRPSVVIKSTVPPLTTQRLQEKYNNIYVNFSPEFLTEANFINDFKNQNRIVIGGQSQLARAKTVALFQKAYPKVPILETSSTVAEMVKYVSNCFLATKVSFANEMYDLCSKLGIQWDRVVDIATYDKRLGSSHWKVPGPDTKRGFGLSCFPKDLNALRFLSKELGIESIVLDAVWEKNLNVRPEEDRDWEKMEKAVNKNA